MKQSKRLQSSLVRKDAKARRGQPKIITNFTSRPFESSLADFCTSKNSKNQLGLPPKKQMVKFSKVQKSGRKFSPGLDFRFNCSEKRSVIFYIFEIL